jgi:ATP-dependent Zn protease
LISVASESQHQKSGKMKKKQLAVTAHHEAGHAVACLVYGFAIRKVSIKRKARTAGRVKTQRSLGGGSEEELRNLTIVLFAGEKAEQRQ